MKKIIGVLVLGLFTTTSWGQNAATSCSSYHKRCSELVKSRGFDPAYQCPQKSFNDCLKSGEYFVPQDRNGQPLTVYKLEKK